MKKLLSAVVLLIIGGTFLFAGATGESKQPSGPEKEEVQNFTLKFHTLAPPSDYNTKAMYVFKDELEKSTNGRITVEIFHSGQLFTQEAEQTAVQKGDIDINYSSPGWWTESFPEWSFLAALYIYKDIDHMYKILNGEIGMEMYDQIAQKMGIRPLGAIYFGQRHINLRDIGKEVRTPEDMHGIKLRVPPSPACIMWGKALGANPTPISYNEIYLALKTGTIDGQENPIDTIYNLKAYEVTKYIILTGHYIVPHCPTINEKKWQALGPELQAKVYEAVEKMRAYNHEGKLNAEKDLLAKMKEEGMIVVEPDLMIWKQFANKVYLDEPEKSGADKWDMELYNRIAAEAD
jgi:tripartite ATP-independent transporter DctP family solute receptor